MDDELDVRIFATLRLASGKAALGYRRTGPDDSVRDVLQWLDSQLGFDVYSELVDENGAIRPGTMLLLDGKNVHHLDGLGTPLRGARLDIFPPSGGG